MPVKIINEKENIIAELTDEEYNWLLEAFRQYTNHFGPLTFGYAPGLSTRDEFEVRFKWLQAIYKKLTGKDTCGPNKL